MMSLLKMSPILGVDRLTLKYIAKANKVKYIQKDGAKLYNIFEIQNLLENKTIAIYKPVYITTKYHIYESKMNYINDL